MADSKPGNNDPKSNEENPILNSSPAAPQSNDVVAMNEDNNYNNEGRQNRTPFTDLSQVDADLALARTLQEQVSIYILYLYLLFFLLKLCVFFCAGLSLQDMIIYNHCLFILIQLCALLNWLLQITPGIVILFVFDASVSVWLLFGLQSSHFFGFCCGFFD